jgi:predicted metalloprotease with PDZ domain
MNRLTAGTGRLLAPFALLLASACASVSTREPRAGGRSQGVQPAPGSLVSAPVRNVRYDVAASAAQLRTRTLHVAMSFDVVGTEPVLLSLPAWTPGAYEISNFARNVTAFTPTSDGNALPWNKADPDTWRIVPRAPGRVEVAFLYVADSLDNAMSWTRPDFAMFNGTNLFMYPEGRGFDFPAVVTVHADAKALIATGMTPADAPATFTERNYHDLVDMPFFVGRFDMDSAQIAGTWVRFATYPVSSVKSASRKEVWDQLRRMIPPEAAVFGEVPWRSYTILQIIDSTYSGASGLEHQSSHLDVVSPLFLGESFMPSLYAHEIFHAWNVKRLRPADLVPYRYDAWQPTPWLWVSEGITDYYADLAEVRGGVVDSAGFFSLTTVKIQQVASLPAVSLEDASLSAWIKPVDGTETIYYEKGSLAGLLLDVLIRDASDNARSLDDVMRGLYLTTYKQGGRGFTHDDWWRAVSRAANGRSFADFERRHIAGRDAFPFDSVLPLAGMRLLADTARDPWLGVNSVPGPDGALVVGIEPGSPAAQAGVLENDVLLTVGDIPVSADDFGPQFRSKFAKAVGSPLPLKVKRGTQTMTLTGTVRQRLRITRRVVADPSASPKAAKIRNGILRGRTG